MNEHNLSEPCAHATLVTVAMCTYNGERYLDAQIDSILSQTYPHLELIISDDGSTDQTIPLIQKWMTKDARVQLFQNKANLGYNRNFEKAITLGSGNLIAISDQDDIWHPQKLEKIVAVFNDSGIVLVHSAVASIKGQRISDSAAKHRFHFQGSNPRPLFFQNLISGHAMVFRCSLLPHILPIPQGMYYDWWIAVTAACNGRVKVINECLVTHRLHEQNAFFQKEQKQKKAPHLLGMLMHFDHVKGLNRKDATFLQHMQQLIERHQTKRFAFDAPLFTFLWKNRKTFFGYKKRTFPVFTYLKYCLRYARKQF